MLSEKLMFELPIKPFSTEAAFTSRLGKQIHDAGGMAHKISDEGRGYKPCDMIFGLDGYCGWMEIKVGKEKQRVDIGIKLRPNQHFMLNRYQKNGGIALVCYYSIIYHRYYILEYGGNLNLLISK